ncbi:MAG: FAD-dependent oxidoreductase [Candidatus Omnitrophica bacterium]|nr:FAD-dependent oxidoreductase [Candidatus Omnitrophota bacterium]
MKHITVLGAGCSGLALSEELRHKSSDLKITLIDKEAYSFDKKQLVSSLSFTERVDLSAFCHNTNIEFVQARVEKINPSRKKIYRKDAEPLDFDVLVMATGLSSKKLEIKGDYRDGFFYLADMEPFKLKELLKISAEATVSISTMLGLRLSYALKAYGKEVSVIAANLDFLGDSKDRVLAQLKEKNINVYRDAVIEEVIGEGAIKAVKISPLKVFSSQLVFIDSGYCPAIDLFEGEAQIKDTFFSNFQDIYFLGDATRQNIAEESFYAFNRQEAAVQAHLLADYFLGGPMPVYASRVLGQQDRLALIEDFLNTSIKVDKG